METLPSQVPSVLAEPISTLPVRESTETKHERTDLEDREESFPDGGLRAWLVVLGVCSYRSLVHEDHLLTWD